jgi:hypothetical protein
VKLQGVKRRQEAACGRARQPLLACPAETAGQGRASQEVGAYVTLR